MSNENHKVSFSQQRDLQKVRFVLDEDDVSMGVVAETLWAIPLGRNEFEVDNIPFYVYGVSRGDVVGASPDAGLFNFKRVLRRGGHSTYRVLISDELGYESDTWKERWPHLAVLGCLSEIAKLRWIAIDIPAFANADDVYAILEQGKTEGVWTIDEGHCGHPL